MSPTTAGVSFSCLATSACLSSAASSRVDLVAGDHRVVAGSHDAAQVAEIELARGRPWRRRRGRAIRRRAAWAATARPSDSRPAAGISSLPSAFRRVFCSCTAWRTAGMPPCRARSATARCSSGRSASTVVRWARPGLSRFGFGRCGSSGGGVKLGRPRRSGRGPRRSPSPSPGDTGTVATGTITTRTTGTVAAGTIATRAAGRSPPGRSLRGPRGRSPRSPRSRSPRGRSPRSRLASCWVTASNGVVLGRSSSRPVRAVLPFGSVTEHDRHAVELHLHLGAQAPDRWPRWRAGVSRRARPSARGHRPFARSTCRPGARW